MRKKKSIKIQPGTTIKMLAVRWVDPYWEFDCPVALLEPVYRFYEDGRSLDSVFEDTEIEGCVNGEIHDYKNLREYNLSYLKKIARQVLAGKKFPRKQVWAEERKVTFELDRYGELRCSYWPDDLDFREDVEDEL